MAMITAQLNTGDEKLYRFNVHGYAVPLQVWENPYSSLTSDNWYYLNSNGYAQKFNPDRPPSKWPSPERLILVPDINQNI
jgi:hypothetical protein